MNDRQFIELLNLYLDREITPSEVVELETEIQRDPAHRQVFNQYSRMDRACTMVLSQNPVAPAPRLAAALAGADRKVVGFPAESGGRSRLVFIGGLMAVAAAVALVFVNRDTAKITNPVPTQPSSRIAVLPQSVPVTTGREGSVVYGGAAASGGEVRSSLAWMAEMKVPRTPPTSDEELTLLPRSEKPFSSGLTWGLHRGNTSFPKAGAALSPTLLNAYEVGK